MPSYPSKTKEGTCIFCEIARGSIKPLGDGVIYEDRKHMAWLSPFPNTEGFTVVIPKRHFGSDVLAMPDKDLKEFVAVSKKVSKMLLRFKDVGRVGLMMEGTGIDHAHIKLYPMHGTAHMKRGIWRQHFSSREDYFEAYPGFMMSNDGPQADLKRIAALARRLRK